MENAKVYILVLNWNNREDTVSCLESVLQNSYPNYQIVVVDNGSTDGSEERILGWAEEKSISFTRYDRETAEKGGTGKEGPSPRPSMIFIQTGGNLGYAGGNNVGIRYVMSKGDASYIWILNNDTAIERDALTEMIRLAETDYNIGMVGSKLLYHHAPEIFHMAGGCRIVPWTGNASMIATGEKDDGRWDTLLEPDYISGASLLVKKKVVETIGLIEEKYFLYWEDADWGERARRKGYRLLYCPTSRVWHKEGATSGGVNPVTDYYWVRNGLMFTWGFHPCLLPLVLPSYLAKYTIVRTLKRKPRNLGAFIRGVLDFLRGRTGRRP